MQDLAHALRKPWRSITKLQSTVLAGKYGNKQGVLKPFDSMRVEELREELAARGIEGVTLMKKPELQQKLEPYTIT